MYDSVVADLDEECEECGAPRKAGLVACSYCETRYRGAPPGLNCPKCGDDNDPSQIACATCASSLLRTCVFCEQATSIAASQCGRCGESFEGAAERKQQRIERQRQQQLMGLAASGFSAIGQAANTPRGRGFLDDVLADLAAAAMGQKK